MHKNDLIWIRHMLDSAGEILEFCRGRERDHLKEDRMLALSITKSIEIIGEAASKVGSETREAHPGIPWSDIVGMRNRLIHAYFDIDLDRVWDTVIDDIPTLVEQLTPLISQDGKAEGPN